MGVDAVYLLDEKKQIRRVIVWGVYELIHDEATYELDAEIESEYNARPGEFLAFFDVDAHLRLFEIDTAEKDERRGVTVITATDAAVAELAHLIVPEIRMTGKTAKESVVIPSFVRESAYKRADKRSITPARTTEAGKPVRTV